MPKVSIDPITRLEGHGKIDIFLDAEGAVQNAYLQIPELRGFERFCVGRLAEDMPNLTARICGVCPEAHHMAAAKAVDDLFKVELPPTAKKLREMFYSLFYTTDHTTHFYALGGPDFVLGPDAHPAERNVLGVVKKVGMEIAGKVLEMRKTGHDLIQMIGGRRVHPNWAVPGGVSKGITEDQRKEIEEKGRWAIEFAQFSLQLFADLVLGNTAYVDLIKNDAYIHKTYNMGLVDENNYVNFYDGKVRVTSPSGKEHARYDCHEYTEYVAEHVEPWSYLKFPRIRASTSARRSRASMPRTAWRRRWPRRSTRGSTRLSVASPSTTRSRPTGRASSSCSTPPSAGSSWPRTPTSPERTTASSRPRPRRRGSAAWRRRAARSRTTTSRTSGVCSRR
jgi:F420-non-reducing hydrogenase large subunit